MNLNKLLDGDIGDADAVHQVNPAAMAQAAKLGLLQLLMQGFFGLLPIALGFGIACGLERAARGTTTQLIA